MRSVANRRLPGQARRGQAGRTLVEIMVASAVLMLLTASCAKALSSAMQYHRRINDQTDLENSLMMAVGALTRDGAETSPGALAWSDSAPEGPALTFPIPRGQTGALLIDHAAGNRLMFGTVVSYRVVGADQELRRYVDILGAAEPTAPHPIDQLTPARDAAYFTPASRPYKTLAKGAVDFELTSIGIDPGNGNEVENVDFVEARIFRLNIKLERQYQRRYAVSIELDIVPRN